MYQKKTPKSQEPAKSWYTIHHCHDIPEPKKWYENTDHIKILSVDPGRRNFCLRIENRDLKTGRIATIAFQKIDFIGENVEDTIMNIDTMYIKVTTLLDNYLPEIKSCHVVIIERQLSINYKMVRLSQHVITYLIVHLRNNLLKTVIMEISSKLKSKQLYAPKGISEKEIKKWSIVKAIELLKIRKDDYAIDIINKAAKSKKDDLADTVVQIEAVFSLLGLPLTEEPKPIKVDNLESLIQMKPIAAKINLDTLPIKTLHIDTSVNLNLNSILTNK